MSDPILKELGFHSYVSMLHRLVGADLPIVYAGPSGALQAAEAADAEEIKDALLELREAESALPPEGQARRLELERGRVLVYARDGSGHADEVGLLGVLLIWLHFLYRRRTR